MFFVVSGFCIHLSYSKSKDTSWIKFFIRRIFRIYPPYLFALCLFFFVAPWGSIHINERLDQLVTHLSLTHNLFYHTYFGINPSFWSIAVEAQLYLIYPLLFLISRRIGWKKSMFVTLVIELMIRVAKSYFLMREGPELPLFISASPFGYLFCWCLGAYLAENYRNKKQSPILEKVPFLVALFVVLLSTQFLPSSTFSFLGFSLLGAIAVQRYISGKWKTPLPTGSSIKNKIWAHLSFLGTISYSFYLIHQPIIGQTKSLLEKYWKSSIHETPHQSYPFVLLWYPILLLLSWIMYKIIELPAAKFGKKVTR